VSVKPRFDFTTQLSGDGHYLFIRPSGLLRPNTRYRVRIRGDWRVGSAPGSDTGTVDTTLGFRTAQSRGKLPLRVRRKRTTAFSISRLAIPLPPLLPSVNQIGFDSYDMIAGTISRTKARRRRDGRLLLWVIGARRDRHGVLQPGSLGQLPVPTRGRLPARRACPELVGPQPAIQLRLGPLRIFDVRGQIAPDLAMLPGTGLYSETTCADVPNYSVQLRFAGVCNEQDTLAASAGRSHTALRRPRSNAQAEGVVSPLSSSPGRRPGRPLPSWRRSASRARRYPAARHVGSILLSGPDGEVVPLDYRSGDDDRDGPRGNLRQIRLALPAGTPLPATVRAYVILDVFPLASRDLP
jgi:hypothetical protein